MTATPKHISATPQWLQALRRFWRSPLFCGILLALSVAATALSQYLDFLASPSTPAKEGAAGTVVLIAAMVLLWLILAILVTSDDVFATTTPFLLLTVLVSSCYDGYALFAPYIWLAIPAVAALLFHFIRYRGRFTAGYFTAPLFAVSLAVTFGGLGCLTAAEYFTPAALYYTAGLGFGMLLLYLLLRASLARPRDYDPRALLLRALYFVGIYAALFTFIFYAVRASWIVNDIKRLGHPLLLSIDNRNVYATFLLFALPAPFYHAARGKALHLIPALLFLAALLMTGSRGGLLCGALLFLLCYLYFLRRDRAHRTRNLVLLGVLALVALAACGLLIKFYTERFANGFIVSDEPRVRLLSRALGDFLSHPIFGVGIGYTGNSDIYDPKTFAMNWYHMMLPQIVAGLGIVGVFAYAFLFYRRGATVARKRDALSRALALSYIGLLLMSQVNPGEFCPMPYAFLGMLIFLLLEHHDDSERDAAARATDKALEAVLATALFDRPLTLPADTDYKALLERGEAHAILGVAGEGLGRLAEDAIPPEVLTDLQDKTLAILRHNEALAAARAALCAYLAGEGIPAAILKGESVAVLYPTPDLRVSGDIDLLLQDADIPRVAAHLTVLGYLTAADGDHHLTLKKGQVKIELHRAPAGIPEGEVGERVSALLADTLATAREITLASDTFFAPDDFHQAIILLLHMQQHLREGGLGLRQLSDFALFLANDLQKSTHARLLGALADIGLLRFAAILAEAAVRHLGLSPDSQPFTLDNPALADALYADILAAGNFGRANADFAGSAIVTLRRKKGRGALSTALSNVAEKCRAEWQICEKHPLLLAVFVPYWVLRRCLRAPVRPLSMLRSASARGALYDKLAIFSREDNT